MCAAPFGPPGGWVLRYFGHARWAKNPKYCEGCFRTLQANHGGAEVDCSLLFADVRGSTSLAERMRPAEFRALMGRFYDEAFAALIDFNAIVDKFVGDEVIGIFIPAYTGRAHARHAIDAGHRLLEVTGHGGHRGAVDPYRHRRQHRCRVRRLRRPGARHGADRDGRRCQRSGPARGCGRSGRDPGHSRGSRSRGGKPPAMSIIYLQVSGGIPTSPTSTWFSRSANQRVPARARMRMGKGWAEAKPFPCTGTPPFSLPPPAYSLVATS